MNRARLLVRLLVAALAVAAPGCSEKFEREAHDGNSTGNTGQLGLQLDVGGTRVSAVNYILTNGTHTYRGAVQVSDASQLLAVIGGIEAGAGYVLTLNAVGTGGVPCNGAS